MTTPSIAIDKSYLFGSPKSDLYDLFLSYEVVMTEALFFELLTTEPYQRARCFARLPPKYNPVVLVPNVGPILQWEVRNQQPLKALGKVAINEKFRFNPHLVKVDYEIEPTQARDLAEWRKEIKVLAQQFADHASIVDEAFPELVDYFPGQETSRIDEAKHRICTERVFVGSFYHNDDLEWPTFEMINEEWALYRWLQIRLLAALDHFKKYGKTKISGEAKVIENEYLDLEYCLVACLCGGLATRDRGLANRYSSLCAAGTLLS